MDPFSITVSVLTLVHLCIKSSATLHKAIDGFNNSKRDVQYLKAEIGDLNIVLQALEKHMQEATENFEGLRLILQQCRQVCEDFHNAVLDALGAPDARLQGVKAWVRLQYRGSDIENFRKLIGSYKVTITIVLADSNLRTSKVTNQLLDEYFNMTKKAALNLEEQIEELSAKLDLLRSEQRQPPPRNHGTPPTGALSAKQTLDQKASLEQCLSVCQQLLEHITRIKPLAGKSIGDPTGLDNLHDSIEGIDVIAPRITTNALEMCTQNLSATARYLQQLQEGSQLKHKIDTAQIIQELDSAQRCLEIVKVAQQPRVNTFERIDAAEDCRQVIVSTIGELIKATGLTIGARTVNIMGQMSDESLQKIADNFRSTTPNKPPSTEKPPSAENGVRFENKHGFGYTIPPRT